MLIDTLHAAAAGAFPPEDGRIEVEPPPPGRTSGVFAFTGHVVIAADVELEWVDEHLPRGDIGAPMTPTFLSLLAGQIGCRQGSHDVVLAGVGHDRDPPLDLLIDDASRHPRADRARRYRDDVRTYTTVDRSGVLVLGRGVAGRWEAAFEVDPAARRRGLGRALAMAALCLVGPGRPLFMQVAPGHAASLRAVLGAGLNPIGSEAIFVRPERPARLRATARR